MRAKLFNLGRAWTCGYIVYALALAALWTIGIDLAAGLVLAKLPSWLATIIAGLYLRRK